MKNIFCFALLLSFLGHYAQVEKAHTQDSLMLRKIYDYYLTNSKCYSNLEELCTGIGARLSGSPQAEKAVQWAKRAMYAAKADTVILQPCIVPR